MGWWDKIKGAVGMGAGAVAAAPAGPVSAIAGAVGGIAGAVKAGEELADHKQMLGAGQAEGVLLDVAKTEERVAAAAAARDDKRVRDDVDATRYRD